MKYLPIVLLLILVIITVTWGIRAGQQPPVGALISKASPTTVPGVGFKPPSPPPTSSTSIKPDDWQEFRNDRQTTLNSNPVLASEYKSLLTAMDNQQKDLEAAMIKADPQVAPVVTKLDSIRNAAPAPVGSPSTKPKPTLSQDDMAQLRAARFAALKNNPKLEAKAKQLAIQLRNFQQKLSSAMVQSDPNVAPIIAKIGTGQPPVKTNPPSKNE